MAMRIEEWQKVEELLGLALELDPARRRQFLDRIAEPELRREVESLLACEEKGGGRGAGTQRGHFGAELRNIVAMAMREEAERRYPSVAQLPDDVRRYLDGLPVRAQPDSLTYRAGKFVRRNKAGVAAALVVLLSLVAGGATAAWQARRATEQARIAAQERDRARVEAAKAERINAFLQDVLGFSSHTWLSPNPRRNPNATIAEAVEEASRRADTELADQPEVLAAVSLSLAQSYTGLGKAGPAEQHLRKSLDIRRRVLGPEHQGTAISMSALGEFLVSMGKFPEAESLAREAVAVFRRERETRGVNSRWFASSLNNVGIALISKGDAAAGEPFIREALEVSTDLPDRDRQLRVIAYSNLSVALGNRGDVDGAIDALRMSLEELRRVPGDKGLQHGIALGNLASFLIIRGDYAEAEPLLRESLESYRKIHDGKNQPATWSLVYLADYHYLQGDYRRAREEVERALKIQRQLFTGGHIDFARSWTVLGKILTRTGEAARGESYLRKVPELRERAQKGHWRHAETQGALGENLTAQKRYAEAEPLLAESYNTLKVKLSERDPRTREARRRLATLYEAWQKPDAAAHFAGTRAAAPFTLPSPHAHTREFDGDARQIIPALRETDERDPQFNLLGLPYENAWEAFKRSRQLEDSDGFDQLGDFVYVRCQEWLASLPESALHERWRRTSELLYRLGEPPDVEEMREAVSDELRYAVNDWAEQEPPGEDWS